MMESAVDRPSCAHCTLRLLEHHVAQTEQQIGRNVHQMKVALINQANYLRARVKTQTCPLRSNTSV